MFHHVYHILEAARQQGRVSADQRGFIPTNGLVMVDFNFDVNELFRAEITAVRSDLIPVGYLGNKNHSLVQQQVGKSKQGKQNKTKVRKTTLRGKSQSDKRSPAECEAVSFSISSFAYLDFSNSGQWPCTKHILWRTENSTV